jgi:hypothetical protein
MNLYKVLVKNISDFHNEQKSDKLQNSQKNCLFDLIIYTSYTYN